MMGVAMRSDNLYGLGNRQRGHTNEQRNIVLADQTANTANPSDRQADLIQCISDRFNIGSLDNHHEEFLNIHRLPYSFLAALVL
jgi:hypothetical protein